MINATEVGKYFYLKNKELTDIQIQKLVYYAYAWYLIKSNGRELFNENPEAWVHGPVFRSLYKRMKDKCFYENPEQNLEIQTIAPFLDIIYNIYAKYSGNELEIMTHSESPWRNARYRAGLLNKPYERSAEKITKQDILNWIPQN